jgi:hypothetical protein
MILIYPAWFVLHLKEAQTKAVNVAKEKRLA